MEADAKRPNELSDSGNLSVNWNLWKKEFQTYMKITKGFKKPEDEQVAWLKNFIGPVGIKAFEQISFDNPRDEENMIIVMEKLNKFFLFTKNQKVQRYKFFSKVKENNESIDEYAKDLMEMAKSCNFGDQSRLIILDAIILNIKDEKLRNLLFEEPDLTLNKLKNIYKTYELTKQEAENKNESSMMFKKAEFFKKECSKCGQRHAFKNCPAFGKICHYCKHANHFVQYCPVMKVDKSRGNFNSKTSNIFECEKIVESKIKQNFDNRSRNDLKTSKLTIFDQNERKIEASTKSGIKASAPVSSSVDDKFQRKRETIPPLMNPQRGIKASVPVSSSMDAKNQKQQETTHPLMNTNNPVQNADKIKTTSHNRQKNDQQISSSTNIRASTSLDRPQNEWTTQSPMRNSTIEPSAQTDKNNIIPPSYNSLYPDLSHRAPPAPNPRQDRSQMPRLDYGIVANPVNSNVHPRYREKPKSKNDTDCTIQ